jgi:hypothetical protein
MRRLVVCAAAVLFSTAVMAQSGPATGQRAGGPGAANISETGGKKAPVKKATRQRSGQSAGGPAADAVSETGGKKKKPVMTPTQTRSGQTPGGPRPQ